MHSYHPKAVNYDPRQLLFDNCGECKVRSQNPASFFHHADASTFERAWQRAYDLESENGDREAVGTVSAAERPILEVLWAIMREFERRGMPINSKMPSFTPLHFPPPITHESEAVPHPMTPEQAAAYEKYMSERIDDPEERELLRNIFQSIQEGEK